MDFCALARLYLILPLDLQMRCKHENCLKQATFNLPTEARGVYCAEHRGENMIDVVHKRCRHDGCMKIPTFNFPTEKIGLYCFEHRAENMNDVVHERCRHDGCLKRPIFNFPTEKIGLYCFEHRAENMIDVQNKRCRHDGCMKRPTFNFPTERVGAYCSDHRAENMNDVKNKRCRHDGCMKMPVFNFPTEKIGLYCFEHRAENMIDVQNKRCRHDGCMRQPIFNFPTEKIRLYCSEHRAENMIDVVHKRCSHHGCMKIPTFNFAGEKVGLYCFTHKLPEMRSIKSKICQDCPNTATHAPSTKKRPTHCAKHALVDYVDVCTDRKCSVLTCTKNYTFQDESGRFCAVHAEKYENNIKRKCKFCDILEESTYVCDLCKSIRCKKEFGIVRFIRKNINTPFEYNSSRMLQGCSKKRPDVYFDLPTHCILVEVDEFQHKAYAEECECARISEIVAAIGGRPVILIRFNPDNYRHNGKPIQTPWADRLPFLLDVIREEIIRQHDNFIVELIQLYFNVSGDYTPIQREDITSKVAF
jgi:hypothetical protein